ncbi:protein adenylyltransferase SelO [Sinimarinibacterium sp. CAU 1509]|uniref:protein adenylyltransferase SelO n=1 Tax=Sinimarinibacterium sp. CAU 1509 TaxID=2562283 RepID=UPI00200ADB79|nr:YdiU family protein [Sinimarinibacterium sp. CAU 1509]
MPLPSDTADNAMRGYRIDALPLDNAYARLGDVFSARVEPAPVTAPRLLHLNRSLLAQLGIDPAEAERPEFTEILAGNRPLPGGDPRAMLYAGHQFGGWVPQLGDGRAILLGQLRAPDGQCWDLQLKGAGKTPFSRFGDGRAVLRSSVREYLCGEALHHLGVPTTRALSLIAADDPVRRETLETAAVICRVAPSHVRFGHFEVFYYRDQHEALRELADHVIDAHFPELSGRPDRYERWLREVIRRTAQLIAQWQSLGFCHGVMNTDNMSILGLTLDYGPFGFIDGFNAKHICNHTDAGGRYAYDQQPTVGHWNCSRLVQACLPLLSDSPDQAVEIGQALVDGYPAAYSEAMTAAWRRKVGLREPHGDDPTLINRFVSILHRGRSDFTRSFRALATVNANDESATELADIVHDSAALEGWLKDYRQRLRMEDGDDAARRARMNAVNPKFVLRNHLAQAAIEAAQRGDASEIERLLTLLRNPYDEHPQYESHAAEPPPEAAHLSVSCSS